MPDLETVGGARHALICRIIFLTGAPLSEKLDWVAEHLFQTADPAFGRSSAGVTSTSSTTSSSACQTKWRSITRRLETSFEQHGPDEQAEFLSTASTDDKGSPYAHDVGFLDHSLALLDATTNEETFKSTDTATGTTMQSFYSAMSDAEQQRAGRSAENMATVPPLSITDLRNLPNAADLRATQPHRPAVNLLVGIISVQPLRTVQLRQRSAKMDLVELLVGDDTKAGLSITFWLTPHQSGHDAQSAADLRPEITALRAGHLVLLSNVALSAYAGCVYGQSLGRKGMAHGCTRIYRLQDRHSAVTRLHHKIDKVAAWAEQFLGIQNHQRRSRGAGTLTVLPPDTPD